MLWWKTALQYLGGATIFVFIAGYVIEVEGRVSMVETQETNNTKLLYDIKEQVNKIDVIENDIDYIKKSIDELKD